MTLKAELDKSVGDETVAVVRLNVADKALKIDIPAIFTLRRDLLLIH